MVQMLRPGGVPCLLWAGFLGSGLLLGCQPAAEEPAPPDTLPAAAPSASAGAPAAPSLPAALTRALHQPFREAVLLEPPEGEQRPPDVTLAGKVVGKLYEAIAGTEHQPGLWDQIRFQTDNGRWLNYQACLETDRGPILLELWPQVAPNHVRNFIALARAGYYDGLVFDRIHREEGENSTVLEYVEAGCPLGTGAAGYGSIGYWLKPEICPGLHHEPGSVGAWHGPDPDSAACKFYITLTTAPLLDGQFTLFGKVRQGLEIVQQISRQPVRTDVLEEGRPQQPVVLRRVTIQVTEADQPAGPPLPSPPAAE
jgi:peptidyl-prolyl cis-trans isomerase B (cyclophilin B)